MLLASQGTALSGRGKKSEPKPTWSQKRLEKRQRKIQEKLWNEYKEETYRRQRAKEANRRKLVEGFSDWLKKQRTNVWVFRVALVGGVLIYLCCEGGLGCGDKEEDDDKGDISININTKKKEEKKDGKETQRVPILRRQVLPT